MKIAFFDTHNYERTTFETANEKFHHSITYFDFKLNEVTASVCKDFDAVCVFVNDTINAPVLNTLKELGIRLVILRCAGYNNVNLAEAKKSEITVVRVPNYSPQAVAEHAAALLLSLTRKIPQAFIRTKSANFTLDGLVGRTIHGLTAGIIGIGKIGKCMAEILHGLGMKILYSDIKADRKWAKTVGAEFVSLSQLLAESDVVSLHCPLSDSTFHLINSETIVLMKENAVLINTSRGALIETTALINAIKRKKIGGAALDVYEEEKNYFFSDWSETVVSDDKLIRLMTFPNVIITSHQGFLTAEALNEIAAVSLNNAALFETGKKNQNAVV